MKAKKIFITFTIALIVIGIGIYFVINSRSSQYDLDNFTKAQLVEVYDYETDEIICKYDTKEDIDSFVINLDIEEWKISNIPQEDTAKYYIVMYQEPTKKVQDNENSSDIEQIATMTIYNSGEYVELKVSGIKFDFKTSQNLLDIFE